MEWTSRMTTTAMAITPKTTAWERKRFTSPGLHRWASRSRAYEGPRLRPFRGKHYGCTDRCYECLQANTSEGLAAHERYSSHTYMWINAPGERVWVKYHFKTTRASSSGPRPKAIGWPAPTLTITPRTCTRPLSEATTELDAPGTDHAVRGRQDLPVQPLRLDQGLAARRLSAHPGRQDDLDRNPVDNHTEIEQAAFQPNNMVPGSAPAWTGCCWPGCSPTPTPTGPASA